jgi:hypothetical protein
LITAYITLRPQKRAAPGGREPKGWPNAHKIQAANPLNRGDPNRSREYTEQTPGVNAIPGFGNGANWPRFCAEVDGLVFTAHPDILMETD